MAVNTPISNEDLARVQACVNDIRNFTHGPFNYQTSAQVAAVYASPSWSEVFSELERGELPSSFSSYLGDRDKAQYLLGHYLKKIYERLHKKDLHEKYHEEYTDEVIDRIQEDLPEEVPNNPLSSFVNRFGALFKNEKFQMLLFGQLKKQLGTEAFQVTTDTKQPSVEQALDKKIEARRDALKAVFVGDDMSNIRTDIDAAAKAAKEDLKGALQKESTTTVNPWLKMVHDIKTRYSTGNKKRGYIRREILPTFLGGISPYREAEMECLNRIVKRLTTLRIEGKITALEGYKYILGSIDLLIKHAEQTSGAFGVNTGSSILKTILEEKRQEILKTIQQVEPEFQGQDDFLVPEFVRGSNNRKALNSTLPPASEKDKKERDKQETAVQEVFNFMAPPPKPQSQTKSGSTNS